MNTIGVVIVTYNAEAFIHKCLRSIEAQSVEIAHCVVVDNASEDQTIAQIREHGQVQLIASKENTGFAEGIRIGTEYLLNKNCTHIIWWNPDLVGENTMVEELVKGMEETGASLAQPAILLPDHSTINTTGNALTYVGISYCRDYTTPYTNRGNTPILAVSGALLCVTEKAYRDIGPLDKDFFLYMEDTDFSWRAFLRGHSAYCIGNARAYHDYKPSYLGKKFYYLERNRLLMLYKNYTLRTLIVLFPLLCILEGGLIVFSLLKGVMGWKVRALWDALWLLPAMHVKRKHIQTHRVRSDKDVLALMERQIQGGLFPHPYIAQGVNGVLRVYYLFLQAIQKR